MTLKINNGFKSSLFYILYIGILCFLAFTWKEKKEKITHEKFINELIYINRNMGLVTKIILIVIFISIAMNLSHSHIFSLNF